MWGETLECQQQPSGLVWPCLMWPHGTEGSAGAWQCHLPPWGCPGSHLQLSHSHHRGTPGTCTLECRVTSWGWQEVVGPQDHTGLGTPVSLTVGVYGQRVLHSQLRGACTPQGLWDRGAVCAQICVCVRHVLGSVTEGQLEICSCMLPFFKCLVLWLSVVLLMLSPKIQFNDCQSIAHHE